MSEEFVKDYILAEYDFCKDYYFWIIENRNKNLNLYLTILAGLAVFIVLVYKDLGPFDSIILTFPFVLLFVLGLMFTQRSISTNKSALWVIHRMNVFRAYFRDETGEVDLFEAGGSDILSPQMPCGFFRIRLKYTNVLLLGNTAVLSVIEYHFFMAMFHSENYYFLLASFFVAYFVLRFHAERQYKEIEPYLLRLHTLRDEEIRSLNEPRSPKGNPNEKAAKKKEVGGSDKQHQRIEVGSERQERVNGKKNHKQI